MEVFFSYAHEDEALRDKLAKHLKLLERQGVIKAWHDRDITAGEEWKNAIDNHLESANIILLLVSSDFLAWGDLALAMAGTATEQFVGLGKPALVIPGAGPQFTRLFAERQC
jgi:uncharacterized protein (TIGR03492 family)